MKPEAKFIQFLNILAGGSYSVAEIALRLSCSTRTVHRYINAANMCGFTVLNSHTSRKSLSKENPPPFVKIFL